MKVPGKPRRIEIDFVRGIAILMVMMVHMRVPEPSGVLPLDFFKSAMMYFGGSGVTLFFVLSGFLVGGLLMKEYKDTQHVRAGRFLLRRMFKIWPAYYFFLAFHAVARHHPFHSFFWQNFFHIQNYVGSSIMQTWSLGVEEHFYLAMPLLMLLVAKFNWSATKMLWFFGTIGAASFICRLFYIFDKDHFRLITHQTQFNVDSLICGVMIAIIYHFKPNLYRVISRRMWLLAVAVVLGVLSTTLPRNNWTNPFDNLVGYLASGAFLMLMLEHSGSLAKMWPFRAISTVGIYSYGIYLYHSLMLGTGEKIVATFPRKSAWIVAFIVQIGGGIIFGVIGTRVVEWPFLFWRERIRGLNDQSPLMTSPNEGALDPVVEFERVPS